MIKNLSSLEDNTTSPGQPYLFDQNSGVDPTMDAASNRTEFTSMTAVGLNTVVAAAVLFNNTVLLVTLGRTRQLWSSTNAYIASLAAADLLVGVMMVVRNFWIIPETAWVFHTYEYVCMPIVCLLYVSCLESITCLAMVSLDRYVYIVWPFWYERHVTKRLITTSIACSWIVCIAIGFLPMRLNKFSPESGCDPLSIISREYLLYGLNSYLFGAEVLIAAMYGRIYSVGNQQRKKIEAATGGNLRQRFNSKSSGKSSCTVANGDRGVSEEVKGSACKEFWVKPRATTVAVVGLSWRQERQERDLYSNVNGQGSGFNLCHGIESDISVDDMELSVKEEKTVVDGSGVGAQPNGLKSPGQGGSQQSTDIPGSSDCGGDARKRSLFDRVTKLRKLKKFSFSSTRESIASRWQVIRFLILVCGTFFVCWTPLQIIGILYFTVGAPVIAISVGISFAAINSALNLYILIAMNKTFKAALLKMVCPASYLSRVKHPHRWRKEDMEFVSDYNPVPRPSLPGASGVPIDDESPKRVSGVIVETVSQCDKDCTANGSVYSQHADTVPEEEEAYLQHSDSMATGDTMTLKSNSTVLNESDCVDSEVEYPDHTMTAVPINDTPTQDSMTVIELSPTCIDSETRPMGDGLCVVSHGRVLQHGKSESNGKLTPNHAGPVTTEITSYHVESMTLGDEVAP